MLDLALRPAGTTVSLRSGGAMTLDTPAGPRALGPGSPLTLPTRTAGPLPDNLARCRPARASADDASAPADAAVDGSLVTAWASGEDPGSPHPHGAVAGTISRATLTWDESRPLAPYALQARVGGTWRTIATVRGTSEVDEVTFAPVSADAVRLRIPATRQAGENPRLAELTVAA